MTLRDHILAALDVAGDDLHSLRAGPSGVEVSTATCAGYSAACRSAGAKPDAGRPLVQPIHRTYETITRDDLLIRHLCWPHLACWEGV